MSCVNDQTRRQQALTRVAASRVRVVDSAESVRRGVQGCVHAFPLSGAALKMGGGVLAGLVIAGVENVEFLLLINSLLFQMSNAILSQVLKLPVMVLLLSYRHHV